MRASSRRPPLVYCVAGEASGDQLGAMLIQALKAQTEGNIHIEGVGGSLMEAQGLKSLFPMEELSIMGLIEVIPHIPNVLARLGQTVRDIQRLQPNVVVTLDSPGFNFRLAKKFRGSSIPFIHYTAPTVWAWRPGRAQKIASLFKHLLALFPFEPPYFEKVGLPCTFIGHPLVEKHLEKVKGGVFRKKHKIPETAPLICLLPGSRKMEIKRLLPVFMEMVLLLKSHLPHLQCVIPVPVSKEALVRTLGDQKNFFQEIPTFVVTTEKEKFQAMKASQVATAASGTVTLELALVGIPMVVAYRVSKITEYILRRLLLISSVSLVNILQKTQVVPELLQENCRADRLAEEISKLLEDKEGAASHQKESFKILQEQLKSPGFRRPSEMAAEVILGVINES